MEEIEIAERRRRNVLVASAYGIIWGQHLSPLPPIALIMREATVYGRQMRLRLQEEMVRAVWAPISMAAAGCPRKLWRAGEMMSDKRRMFTSGSGARRERSRPPTDRSGRLGGIALIAAILVLSGLGATTSGVERMDVDVVDVVDSDTVTVPLGEENWRIRLLYIRRPCIRNAAEKDMPKPRRRSTT